jgi:hypothetical protein
MVCCPDPWLRAILADTKHALGGFDLVPGPPEPSDCHRMAVFRTAENGAQQAFSRGGARVSNAPEPAIRRGTTDWQV